MQIYLRFQDKIVLKFGIQNVAIAWTFIAILFLNVMGARHDTNVTRKVSRTSVIYKSCSRMYIQLFLNIHTSVYVIGMQEVESRNNQQLLPTYGQRWPPGNENARPDINRQGALILAAVYMLLHLSRLRAQSSSQKRTNPRTHMAHVNAFQYVRTYISSSGLLYSFFYHFT